MLPLRRTFSFVMLGLLSVSACGSEVRVSGTGDSGGDGDGDAVVDMKCYEACIEKGVPADDCDAYCTAYGSGGKAGTGAKGTGAKGTGASGSAGSGASGTGGTGVDPAVEKSCIQCWYDEAEATGACAVEAKACEQSLACTQLQWCPLLCEKEGCWEECNEIIPTGVEPLSNLVQCMACDGGPCEAACQDSVLLSYCD